MDDADIDFDRIDEAVLALMFLTLHDGDRHFRLPRAWKGFDWDALNRLHAKELISDPVGKAKSVLLTEEGLQQCEALFKKMFLKKKSVIPPAAER